MREAILDTDTLSYVLGDRYPEVSARARQYVKVFGCLSVSAISIAEAVKGITRQAGYGDALVSFLREAETFEVFPIYQEEATLAGRILGALLASGQQIGALDPFIAATAIENNRPLVTNNIRHYQRIVDLGFPLLVENWRDPDQP